MIFMKSFLLFFCLLTGITWGQSSNENPLQKPLPGYTGMSQQMREPTPHFTSNLGKRDVQDFGKL